MQASRRYASGVCIFCRHARPTTTIANPIRSRRTIYVPAALDPRPSKRDPFLDGDEQDNNGPRIIKHTSHKGFKPPEDLDSNRRGFARDGDARDRRRYTDDRDGPGGHKSGRTFKGRDGKPRFGRNDIRINFSEILDKKLKDVRRDIQNAPIAQTLQEEGSSFSKQWVAFTRRLKGAGSERKDSATFRMYTDLKTAHSTRGEGYLEDRLKYAFYGQVTGSRFTSTDIKNQQNLADLRYPSEWFPATRTMDRSIHMHVGPTNSGKTYHALKRLEAAGTGMYAGPLRLLAHEVYTRLNAAGKPCVLVTGEERRRPDDGSDDSNMISCTVEMMPMNKTVDVAVIDEIQMIGSPERGWAWTQALLGVKAHELHLCGEARTVPLVREICASIGEKVIVHEYERLSPLQMEEGSLNGNFSQLRKGDCIVSFSVVGIHSLRRQIERETGKKVATVYGSLPPETRAQQARLFNNPDNDYDYLVASDAIGMGLNLSIKRIIFEESHKFDGYRRKPLAIADIKQIGGRAGRYRSADLSKTAPSKDLSSVKGESSEDIAVEKVDTVVVSSKGQETPATSDTPATSETPAISENRANSDNPAISENPATSDNPYDRPNPRTGFIISKAIVANDAENATAEDMAVRAPKDTKSVGLVTTLEKFDFPLIAKAMESEPEPIRTAGIFPPAPVVERFAQYFPTGTPFSFIMLRLHELSQMHSRFHLCGLRDQLYIADLIEPVRNLTVADRITFCAVPASKSDIDLHRSLIPALARCIEQQGGGDILDIEELPIETLELELSPSRQYLRQLEQLHKGIIAYLWLSYRFAGIFTTRALAFHIKTLVEEKIERVLSGFSFTEQERQKERARKEKEAVKNMQAQLESENEEGADNVDSNMSATPSDAQSSNITGNSSFSGDFDMGLLDDASEDNGIDARDVEPKYPADGDRDQASRSFTDSAKDDGDVDVDDSIPDVLATDHETPESKDEDDEVRSDAALSDSEPTVDAESGVQHEADSDVTPLETQLEPPSEPPSEVDGAETERQEKKA